MKANGLTYTGVTRMVRVLGRKTAERVCRELALAERDHIARLAGLRKEAEQDDEIEARRIWDLGYTD